jgi:hypothetical protein
VIKRRVAVLAGAVVTSATVAACGGGSSGPGSTPPATTSPVATQTVVITQTPTPSHATSPTSTPSTPVLSAPACTTGELKLSLGSGQGTAGSTYQPVIFTNTSSKSCSLYGYPGVSFVDSSGTQLGKPAARSNVPHFSAVTLAARGAASALLQLPDPGVFSPGACNEVTADRLKVYPPNQLKALLVSDHAQICTTKRGRTIIGPVHSGTDG